MAHRNQRGMIRSGFARAAITPSFNMPLYGMGDDESRMPNTIQEDLTASVVALLDENELMTLVYSLDVLWIHRTFYERARTIIAKALAVDESHIYLCATHTHAGPVMGEYQYDCVSKFEDNLIPILVRLAQNAVCDLDECRISTGKIETKYLNNVRRYFSDSGILLSVGNEKAGIPICPETRADRTLQTVCFERNCKQDILLVNFAVHPQCGKDLHAIHPSFVGKLRSSIEEEKPMYVMFLQGAQGNLEPWHSLVDRNEVKANEAYESYELYGEAIAKETKQLLSHMKKCEAHNMYTKEIFLYANVDHTKDALAKIATELLKEYNANMTLPNEIVRQYDLHTATELRRVVRNAVLYHGVEQMEIPIKVLGIGDIALVFVGCELFCQSGMQIKSASPFGTTMICGNSCGSLGYLPASECFVNGGFEVYETTFVRGTAEALVDCAIDLLYNTNDIISQRDSE